MKKDKSVERGCSSCCSVLWLYPAPFSIFRRSVNPRNPFQHVVANSEPGGVLQCLSKFTSDVEPVL